MTITDLDYPHNLLDAIDVDSDELFSRPYPSDLNGTLEYILITFLSERSADVIRQRFKQGKTHSEIGNEYQLTNERIRQIEERALKELRRPKTIKLLQNGVSGAMKLSVDNAIEQVRMDELASAVAYLRELCINKTNFVENPVIVTKETVIEQLDLTVRCYNCIKRAGINKVGDIEKMTFREFRRIRNLGKQAYDDLISKLAEHGFVFQEETDPDERIVLKKLPVIIG